MKRVITEEEEEKRTDATYGLHPYKKCLKRRN